MEKAGGRPRDEVWQHVKVLEGGRRVKCNYCKYEFAASANRIKSHIKKDKGKGIRVCPNFPQSHNFASDNEGNSNHLKDNLLHSQGSSFVSNGENEDLQMMKRYVFECLRPEDRVFVSPLSYLTQQYFITLEPETPLDSFVIDVFVEILTVIERKKKTMPLNWYLPVTFSDKALEDNEGRLLHFVHCQKMKENYMSDLESCEKIFIPVHVGARPNGHFHLYIIHIKNKKIEIWDSLPNTSEAEIGREETTKKLLLALEKLFEEAVLFTKFHLKMANDILLQFNGFDSGIFVINYMQQSDNYVKRNPLFQYTVLRSPKYIQSLQDFASRATLYEEPNTSRFQLLGVTVKFEILSSKLGLLDQLDWMM
ncbi:hypothetical protein K1719_023020 [Acacia pycnantha]|nr:hypothetical protein K1719_023020 [Acacia pycnantha]